MNNHLNKLNDIITKYNKICIAFSGGVDSSLLLYYVSLSKPVVAVIIDGDMVPRRDIKEAETFVKNLNNVELIKAPFDVFSIKEFTENSNLRCYYCKKALFQTIIKIAQENHCDVVFDGTNKDDLSDYRPGLKAIQELQVVSPFLEAGLNKTDIYNLSNYYDLPTKNKNSSACLASRIKTDDLITKEKLSKIEQAEEILQSYSFKQLRFRLIDLFNGYIEIKREDFSKFYDNLSDIENKLKAIHLNIEKDPYEYKRGSMNKGGSNESG